MMTLLAVEKRKNSEETEEVAEEENAMSGLVKKGRRKDGSQRPEMLFDFKYWRTSNLFETLAARNDKQK